MIERLSLFVYGTLMSDQASSSLLAGLGRQPARTRGRLFALRAGYPALVPGGDAWVYGELVAPVTPRRLTLLDQYEGVPEGLYRRTRVEAVIGLSTFPAWAWVMDDPSLHGGRYLPGGRWRATIRR